MGAEGWPGQPVAPFHTCRSSFLSSYNWKNFPFVLEEGQMALVASNPRSSLAARCFPTQARSQPTALTGLPWQTEEQHSLETAVFLSPPGSIASK